LDNLEAAREKFQAITNRFASFQFPTAGAPPTRSA